MVTEERVVVFIDGSNFYYALKRNLGTAKIDFSRLSHHLCNNRRLIRTYYYNVPVDPKEDEERYKRQQKFFDGLRRIDYLEIVLGRLEKRQVKIGYNELANLYNDQIARDIINKQGEKVIPYNIEKGVDIAIAVDMLNFAYRNIYDTAILVSGDGDFARAVQAVKNEGKHVEVAFFRKDFSYHLEQVCDKCIYLDDFIKECLVKT